MDQSRYFSLYTLVDFDNQNRLLNRKKIIFIFSTLHTVGAIINSGHLKKIIFDLLLVESVLFVLLYYMFLSLDLHQRIVELESELRKSNEHISKIGRELMDNKQLADYEVLKLREELGKLRDRYDRSVSI